MEYVGALFRPPSEGGSLLLQVTVGCSHNRCSFCGMYRDKQFSMKPLETVFRDIDEAAQLLGTGVRRVFLCDGDALILPTGHLARILKRLKSRFPRLTRVSTYGDCRGILKKSVTELSELRNLGLQLVYHGVESGSDEVLRRVGKGFVRADVVTSARKLEEAGIRHSVMFLLGLGGRELSLIHAEQSAQLLTEINPQYASALTLTVVPGTPLQEEQALGKFVLPEPFAMLEELLVLVEGSTLERCVFSSNHASNYLPLSARLPSQKAEVVQLIRETLTRRDPSLLTPEWMRGL